MAFKAQAEKKEKEHSPGTHPNCNIYSSRYLGGFLVVFTNQSQSKRKKKMAENNTTLLFMGLWSAGWLCWACLGSLTCLWSAGCWRSGFADIRWAPSHAWVLARKTGLHPTWSLSLRKRPARPCPQGDVRVPGAQLEPCMALAPYPFPCIPLSPEYHKASGQENRFLS